MNDAREWKTTFHVPVQNTIYGLESVREQARSSGSLDAPNHRASVMFEVCVQESVDRADSESAQLDATVRLGPNPSLVLGSDTSSESIRYLGSYRLIRQLGSGGMGLVYEAEEEATQQRFAIKVLRPTLVLDTDAKKRFFNEAQAMAVIGHQRIVPVVRLAEEGGIPYIVMPLLRGETLEQRMQHGPELSLEEIVRIGTEIAEGLEAAHRAGLIHRDVKPANVWLEDPSGSVRLLDLGIAREISNDPALTRTGIVLGTPAYMSPEQARGETLDFRSDLFSLGCILYQLATGVRPFTGPSPLNVLQQLDSYHPPRVTAKKPAVPTMLSNLIMELLAKAPKHRPDSATSVIERMRRIPLNEERRVAPPVVAPSPLGYAYQPKSDPTVRIVPNTPNSTRGWLFMGTSLLLATISAIWYLTIR